MRRRGLLAAAAGSGSGAASLTPDVVSGLTLWFRTETLGALANGTHVSSWPSVGGNASVLLSAPLDSWRPTYVTDVLNGFPVLRFDGLSNTLSSGGISLGGTEITVIAVCDRTGGGSEGRLISLMGGSGSDKTSDGAAHIQVNGSIPSLWSGMRNGKDPTSPRLLPSKPHVVALRWNTTEGRIWVNRAPGLPCASTSTPFTISTIGIGNGGATPQDSGWFGGDVAEVAVYSRALALGELSGVVNGLIAKYAIDADTSSAPVVASVSLDVDAGTWLTRTSVNHYPLSGTYSSGVAARVATYRPPAIRIPVAGSTVPLSYTTSTPYYGVGYTKGGYYPQTGWHWNFAALDSYISDDYATTGTAPLVCFCDIPAQFPRTTTTDNFTSIGQFMARVVRYYNLGSMTTEGGATVTNPSGTNHRITYWELFNRPSDPTSSFPMSASDFSRAFDVIAPLLRAADPTIKLLVPGDDPGYISALVSGQAQPDVISLRIYAGTNSDKDYVLAASSIDLGSVDSLLSAARMEAGDIPVWIIDTNLLSSSTLDPGGRPWGGLGQVWNADQVRLAGVKYFVEALYTWNLFENAQFGMLAPDGSPYLSYWRNLLVNRFFPVGSTILGSSTSIPDDVAVLAARRPDNSISVLVANRRFNDVTTVGGSGLPADITVDVGGVTVEQAKAQVITGATSASIEPTTSTLDPSRPNVLLPGYGVAWLDFSAEPVFAPGYWHTLYPSAAPLNSIPQSSSEWSWWGQTEPNLYGNSSSIVSCASLGLPNPPRVGGTQPLNCIWERHRTNATGQTILAEQTTVFGDYAGIGYGVTGHVHHGVLKWFTDVNWPIGTEPSLQPDYASGSPDNVSGRYIVYTYIDPVMTIPSQFSVLGIGGQVCERYRDAGGHTQTDPWGFELNNTDWPEAGLPDGSLTLTLVGPSWRGTPIAADPYVDSWVKWELRVYQGERIEAYVNDRLSWIVAHDGTHPVGRSVFFGSTGPRGSTVLAEEGWQYGAGAFLDPDVITQDFTIYVGPALLLPLPG